MPTPRAQGPSQPRCRRTGRSAGGRSAPSAGPQQRPGEGPVPEEAGRSTPAAGSAPEAPRMSETGDPTGPGHPKSRTSDSGRLFDGWQAATSPVSSLTFRDPRQAVGTGVCDRGGGTGEREALGRAVETAPPGCRPRRPGPHVRPGGSRVFRSPCSGGRCVMGLGGMAEVALPRPGGGRSTLALRWPGAAAWRPRAGPARPAEDGSRSPRGMACRARPPSALWLRQPGPAGSLSAPSRGRRPSRCRASWPS